MSENNLGGSVIPLSQAAAYTHAFQELNPSATIAYYVDSGSLNQILQQNDCSGIRIYNGYDAETRRTNLVLVGVSKSGSDMTGGILVEELVSCPSVCDDESSLIK